MTLDQQLFQILNSGFHHPLLDAVLPLLDQSRVLSILLLLPAFIPLLLKSTGEKRWLFPVGAITLFLFTDLLGGQFLKGWFAHLRPSDSSFFLDGTNQLFDGGRFLLGTKDSYSFPSNHALNSCAQATYWSWWFPRSTPFVWAIALVICWSRIYCGVHLPSDILFGAILGGLLGVMWGVLFRPVTQPSELMR